jgi:long-chain acyl-CoA synthetase
VTAAPAAPVAPADVDTLPRSLPGWLLYHAQARPRAVALRTKELGRWREITWREHADAAASVGRALAAHGVAPGDRVLLISENRPEWLETDLAVQGLGAATVALFPTTPAPQVGQLARRCGARVAVVEDEEQLDKVLETRASSSIERVFVIDTRGMKSLEAPAASFEELLALGSPEAVAHRGGDPEAWHSSVAAIDPEGIAAIVYTPGTTGEPKGAMLSHANLAAAARAGVEEFGLTPRDQLVSCLPLCEIAERALMVMQATRAACTVHFGEGGAALEQDVREVEPTVFLGVPRLWDRLRARADAGLRDAGWVKGAVFRAALRRGRGAAARRRAGSMVRDPLTVLLSWAVARPLRRQLGLARTRVALTAAAPAAIELLEWWWAVGVPLREVYGLTESSGVATAMPADDVRLGTVGRALSGVQIATDTGAGPPANGERGEVRLRGEMVFAGYLDGGGDAQSARLEDGWLATGDVGVLDADGFLTIVDRIRDVLITSGGHLVAPAPIAHLLEESPYVSAALVVGEGRPCVGALLAIDATAVGEWASVRGVPYTTHSSLAENADVHDLLADVVSQVNERLPEGDRVRCFTVLPSELSHDGGALTAVGKLRRGATVATVDSLVEGMYRVLDEGGGS